MRRRASEFGELSAPSFRLARVFRGLPAAGADHALRSDPWYRVARGRFMFLLFEKRATSADSDGTHLST
jgi:hypothetical protein